MLMKTILLFTTLSFSVSAENRAEDISADSGTIQSTNYPYGYPVNEECIWSFTVAAAEKYVLVFQTEIIHMYYNPTSITQICTASLKIQSNSPFPDEVDCKSNTPSCYTYRSSDNKKCRDIQDDDEYSNCNNDTVKDSHKFEVKFKSNSDPTGDYSQRRFSMTYRYVPCSSAVSPMANMSVLCSIATSTPSQTTVITSTPTPHFISSSSPVLNSRSTSALTPSPMNDLTSTTALDQTSSTTPQTSNLIAIVIGSLVAILVIIAIAILVVIKRKKRAKPQTKEEKKKQTSSSDYDALYNSTSLKNGLSDEQINTNDSQKVDGDEGLYSQLARDGKINQAYSPTESQYKISKESETNESFTNKEPSDENPYHHLIRDLSSDVKDSQLEKDGEVNQTNNPASQYEVVSDGQINESFTDGDQTDENPYHQLSRDMPADGVNLQEYKSVQEVVDNDYDHLQTGIPHDSQGNQAYDVDFKPEDTYDHLATGLSNPRLSQADLAPGYETAADLHPSKHNPNISQYEEILDLQVSRQNSSPATHEEQSVIQLSAPTENYTQIIPKSERASEENKANA